MIRELTISVLLLSLALGTLAYFSTMQVEKGKQHTHYQETNQ